MAGRFGRYVGISGRKAYVISFLRMQETEGVGK